MLGIDTIFEKLKEDPSCTALNRIVFEMTANKFLTNSLDTCSNNNISRLAPLPMFTLLDGRSNTIS